MQDGTTALMRISKSSSGNAPAIIKLLNTSVINQQDNVSVWGRGEASEGPADVKPFGAG